MRKRQMQVHIDFFLQLSDFRSQGIIDAQQQLNRFLVPGVVIQRCGAGQPVVDFIISPGFLNRLQ